MTTDTARALTDVRGATAPDAGTEERVSILLVDDRPDKLMALEAVLAGLEQNLVLARSGKEALRCLLQRDFAVILLDVNMPGMDGFETAAMIRQRRNSETTPIIFVSAVNDTETHLSRGYSLGAVDYILAPVVPEILRAKVSVFVDLFKKTEQVKRQAEERAEFIREQAARAEAEAAQERFAFLAEASRALSASLDYSETLRNVAVLAVPTLADLCIVDTLEKDGSIRLVAVHGVNQERVSQVRGVRQRHPLNLDIDYFIPKVLRTGETEVMTDLSDAALDAAGWAPEHRTIAREFGVGAYVVVPLVARDRTLGAISLLMGRSGRTYGATEIALAEELAGRAALAVDNAALYAAAGEARQAAETANNAKDHFLATLSHELRTPLSPVLNTVQILSADADLPGSVRAGVEMIRRNVELEARLIDDLLDLTRISKGKVRLRLEEVDAHRLIGTALEICQDDIAAKGLCVETELRAAEFCLHGDAARLHQVFWNLLKNAVKFTPAGGRITLRTSNPAPGQLRAEVTDTGVGIPAEVLPKIFDAFEQGTRARQGGLGLGLAITKAVVELHHGRISAVSKGADQGTTFIMELPTTAAAGEAMCDATPARTTANAHAAATSAGDATTAGNGNGHGKTRVLLVDDHEDTLRSMQMLLKRRGYHVDTADGVQAALDYASNGGRFDVLVSDVGLPDGSGMDLVRQLRAARGDAELRAIALSGYGMEEDIARSREAGFREHLTKPVDAGTLDAVIRRLLE